MIGAAETTRHLGRTVRFYAAGSTWRAVSGLARIALASVSHAAQAAAIVLRKRTELWVRRELESLQMTSGHAGSRLDRFKHRVQSAEHLSLRREYDSRVVPRNPRDVARLAGMSSTLVWCAIDLCVSTGVEAGTPALVSAEAEEQAEVADAELRRVQRAEGRQP